MKLTIKHLGSYCLTPELKKVQDKTIKALYKKQKQHDKQLAKYKKARQW